MRSSNKLTDEMAELLLKISSMLMTSGANTNRILLIMNKFTILMHVDAQLFINHKAFIISLTDKRNGDKTTIVKRLPPHVVNFSTISSLSEAGVKAQNENWKFKKLKAEIDKIEKESRHSQFIVLTSVALAGGGLDIVFGGGYYGFLAVCIGTFFGLFVKQFLHKKEFNVYLGTFMGTLVSSAIVAAIMQFFFPGINPDIAIATSVLFSVPGVPLINSFIDFMDGYFITGMVRFVHGLLFVISIAASLFIVMYLFHIQSL